MDIEIRPMINADLPVLTMMDHSYGTDYVWQMHLNMDEHEIGVKFAELKLPRTMRVDYPWPDTRLEESLQQWDGVMVAVVEGKSVGYLTLVKDEAKREARVMDLVVNRRLRRRQVGSTLLQAASVWMSQQGIAKMRLEMQSKNHPAICMANYLGYEFSGFADQYFPNRDIALFFSRRI
ncbi:MAG: GNAT family N-acetyltransferase [Anaerolineales bacterium]